VAEKARLKFHYRIPETQEYEIIGELSAHPVHLGSKRD
jgi:hypothetical protein